MNFQKKSHVSYEHKKNIQKIHKTKIHKINETFKLYFLNAINWKVTM